MFAQQRGCLFGRIDAGGETGRGLDPSECAATGVAGFDEPLPRFHVGTLGHVGPGLGDSQGEAELRWRLRHVDSRALGRPCGV